MNILCVFPYPPSKIRVRAYNFIKYLRRQHTVTVLVQVRSEQELQDAADLRREEYDLHILREVHWRSTLQSGLALLGQRPLQAAYAYSPQLIACARQLLKERHFDIVHVEHLRGMASMEELVDECVIVWDAVDCISRLWERAKAARTNWKTRLLASLECERTRVYERSLLSKVAHVLSITENDRDAMYALCRQYTNNVKTSAAIDVLSSGVDLDYFSPLQERYQPYNLVFSGRMSYHSNSAAALYLYHQIMPLIWKEIPEATLTIVGSNPPKSLQMLQADRRIRVTGYVEDMRPYVGKGHVMICPLVYSAGMQNKVLEAMALGVPTVISEQAASALAVRWGYDTLVATSPQSFALKTI